MSHLRIHGVVAAATLSASSAHAAVTFDAIERVVDYRYVFGGDANVQSTALGDFDAQAPDPDAGHGYAAMDSAVTGPWEAGRVGFSLRAVGESFAGAISTRTSAGMELGFTLTEPRYLRLEGTVRNSYDPWNPLPAEGETAVLLARGGTTLLDVRAGVLDDDQFPIASAPVKELLSLTPGSYTLNVEGHAGAGGSMLTTGGADLFFGFARLPGDFNDSGLVEQGDLNLALANWGVDTTTAGKPATWIDDPPFGVVDQAELNRVLGGWGTFTPGPLLTVPEPVLGLALLGVSTIRRPCEPRKLLAGPVAAGQFDPHRQHRHPVLVRLGLGRDADDHGNAPSAGAGA